MKKISSLQHPLIKHFVKLKTSKSYRSSEHSLIIEGEHLITELPSSVVVKNLLITREDLLPDDICANEIYLVSEDILKKISSLESSPGILAEIEKPQSSELIHCDKLLILDHLQDPGNLGTLFRSAQAFDFQGIFLLNNCVDPFNDKVIRSTKGAIFKIPFQSGSWDDLEKILKHNHLKLFIADLKGEKAAKLSEKKIALLLGNEANGPSIIPPHIKKTLITIPISQHIDSLNVAIAGSILMYLMSEIS